MATITKRGETYRIRVSCGYDISGKQIMRSTTWDPDPGMSAKQIEKELQRQAVLFEERCRSGQFLDGSIKFAEFAEKWIHDHAEKQLKAKTIARYKKLLIRINQGIGHIRLDKLQPHHIIDFCNNLAEEGVREDIKYKSSADLRAAIKSKNYTVDKLATEAGVSTTIIYSACSGKNISADVAKRLSKALDIKNAFKPAEDSKTVLADRTQLHYFRLISSILSSAVQWQVIPYNVCARVKAPSVKQKEAKYLDDVQVSRLFEYLEKAPFDYRALIHLLLYTGLRRGELLGLKWTDIDFDNSLLYVRRTLLYLPEKGLFEDAPKTDASNRS
ncbi:MAG: tyrosine-type recombinase/integrase [Eubacteriales bacterium]|nr:tyrosine-type recombinase/integrase [Eubacteriales bacterium]